MRITRSRGVGLPELMMVVALFGIVAAGVSLLLSMAFQAQARHGRWDTPALAGQMGIRRMLRDVSAANYIALPLLGSDGNVLEGYIGRSSNGGAGSPRWINPATGDATGTYSRFRYCLDAAGAWHVLHDTHNVDTDPGAPGVCGQGPGWEQIAASPKTITGKSGGAMFSRSNAWTQNILLAWFSITENRQSGPDTFEVRVNLALQSAGAPPL